MATNAHVVWVKVPLPVGEVDAFRREFPDVTFVEGDTLGPAHLARITILFVADPITDDLVRQMPSLQWLHTTSGGSGRFLLPSVVDSPIVVTTSRGIHGPPFTEFALACIYALGKRLPIAIDAQRKAEPARPEIDAVRNKTIGVVGLGTTGSAIARTMHTLGFRVVATKRTVGDKPPYVAELWPAGELPRLVRESDVVVITIPPWPSNEPPMIGRDAIRSMRRGSYVVNISGGLNALDHDAVVDALDDGQLAGAAVNVLLGSRLPADARIWHAGNVIITAGLAGDDPLKWEMQRPVFVENLQHYISGEPLRNQVDKLKGD